MRVFLWVGFVCISVAAVTAAYGSALTAGHFWKSAKSNQKRFAPPLGTSLRLGVPSLRHCSVGPPRRAIHGPARLSRHPCRDAHCAIPAFGQRGLTGRPRSKARSERGGLIAGLSLVSYSDPTVGAGLLAKRINLISRRARTAKQSQNPALHRRCLKWKSVWHQRQRQSRSAYGSS
jgi:hypothetical protein